MSREAFIQALKEHKFDTHGVKLTFGLMDEPVMKYPWGKSEHLGTAGTRLLRSGDIVTETIEEIQYDLNQLVKWKQKGIDISRYGYFLYKFVGNNMLRYAKLTITKDEDDNSSSDEGSTPSST